MYVNPNLKDTRLVIEANHGKATFFMVNDSQNFNFVRFGYGLDKIIDQFQGIGEKIEVIIKFTNILINRALLVFRISLATFLPGLINLIDRKKSFSSVDNVIYMSSLKIQIREV